MADTPKKERVTDIPKLVKELAGIRSKMAPLNDGLKPLKEFEGEVKFELLMAMQKAQMGRSDPQDGYYAVKVVTSSTKIDEADKVMAALNELGENVDDYLALDEKKVVAKAEAILAETGEILPGLTVSTRTHITLNEVKEK